MRGYLGAQSLCPTLEHVTRCGCQHSPQVCHSIQKLLLGELALGGSAKLPRNDQHADAGWIQWEVITKLLDPINTNLILILGIYQGEKNSYIFVSLTFKGYSPFWNNSIIVNIFKLQCKTHLVISLTFVAIVELLQPFPVYGCLHGFLTVEIWILKVVVGSNF